MADTRATITALLAYGREERALGEGHGSFDRVDAALDTLLAHMFPLPSALHVRQCAWCRGYATAVDEALARTGAPVTHGICASCAAQQERAADAAVTR